MAHNQSNVVSHDEAHDETQVVKVPLLDFKIADFRSQIITIFAGRFRAMTPEQFLYWLDGYLSAVDIDSELAPIRYRLDELLHPPLPKFESLAGKHVPVESEY